MTIQAYCLYTEYINNTNSQGLDALENLYSLEKEKAKCFYEFFLFPSSLAIEGTHLTGSMPAK